MAKLIVYSCESCEFETKNPDKVFYLEGKIYNGDNKLINSDNHQNMICSDCLFNFLDSKSKIEDEKIIIENILELDEGEYCVFKKIINTKDEDELITSLGFVTREDFRKTYSKSIMNHYYPIDNEENLYKIKNRKLKETKCQVICKVFAGIPQVSDVNLLVDEKDSIGFLPAEQCIKILEKV